MIRRNPSSDTRKSNRNSFSEPETQLRTIQVVVEFAKIGEIDTMNEKYQAELYVESKWTEPSEINCYDPKIHWNPKLYIENTLTLNKEDVKYELQREQNGNTTITEIKFMKGVFWERLELHKFPIDVQELSVSITSKLTSNELKIVADPQKLSYINFDAGNTFTEQQKWRLFKLVKVSEHASYDSSSSSTINEGNTNEFTNFSPRKRLKPPKFVASCFVARKPGYYVFNAYFLIFLITVSSLTIFSIDPKLPQNRLQTTYTLLLTSVSFKWVINRSLPTVSYLTSLDKYAIMCIFFVCLLCVWHAIIGTFWPADKALDQWLLLAFSIFFILIHVFFLAVTFRDLSEVRKLKKQEKDFIVTFKQRQGGGAIRNLISRL